MTSATQIPEKFEISRQDLYEQVWSTPANRLADKFGVSGSYLARVCDALKVPRPPVGYWQKLAVGKAKPRPDLPPVLPGDQVTWSKDKPLAAPVKRMAQPRSAKTTTPAAKPERASRHPLLQGVEGHFRKTRKLDEGEFLKPYKQLLPDVVTSEACLIRALGLANDIYNALERKGHRVLFAPPDRQMRRQHIEERESPGRDRKYGQYSMGRIWSPHRPTITYLDSIPIDDADPTKCSWHIEDPKNDNPVTLPLSRQAADVLRLRRAEDEGEFVFASWGKTGHITDARAPLRRSHATSSRRKTCSPRSSTSTRTSQPMPTASGRCSLRLHGRRGLNRCQNPSPCSVALG